ncbi:MAG: hypothetical protein R3Y07_04555 [Eubacteriales bacterium]
MKEYGGFFGLELFRGEEYHSSSFGFNYCRTALQYLLRVKSIKKLYMPHYICGSVIQAVRNCNVEVVHYHIDEGFRPILDGIPFDSSILLVNFYGQLDDQYILKVKSQFSHLIVDNTQAFFHKPLHGMDTLYSCRKFFGVPDGGYLHTEIAPPEELYREKSSERFSYLVGCLEETASEHYGTFQHYEDLSEKASVAKMSMATKSILSGINYAEVKSRREENYRVIHHLLGSYNELSLVEEVEGPFGYPFLMKNSTKLREYLLQHKIYVPVLWSNVSETLPDQYIEHHYAKNLMMLPIDQRYDEEDVNYIAEATIRGINNEK